MLSDLTYCDFLILAPLPIEIEAIRSALKGAGWTIKEVASTDFPTVMEASLADSGAGHSERHVMVIQLNDQGVLNASVDTARALELYEPGYVVSFGIAGSLNKSDAPIGTVVFATALLYYEPSKDTSKTTQSRMAHVPVGTNLRVPFCQLTVSHLMKRDGLVASGEKLFADIASGDRKRILATNDKMLAVEMEAAGVGLAVKRLCHSAEFVVLKGISDLADRRKNAANARQKVAHRKRAALNAAKCLAGLMQSAPLRRGFRSLPTATEARATDKAMKEMEAIIAALKPFGIEVDQIQLYDCLYGRNGSIPAYFHWRQCTPALHWIDFKILAALRSLPRDIVTPTPLVTVASEDVRENQPWQDAVYRLLRVQPTTDAQIRSQQNELFSYMDRVGYTRNVEGDIRADLQKLQDAKRPEIVLTVMRYMLGQLCHRRMFVFTWNNNYSHWVHLSRARGIWFAIFHWEGMYLAGNDGKNDAPGKDILIEPGSYASLNRWLSTSPSPTVLSEFIEHFKCHPVFGETTRSGEEQDPALRVKAMTQVWDRLFGDTSQ
jgi:nucleoside phosphorylase